MSTDKLTDEQITVILEKKAKLEKEREALAEQTSQLDRIFLRITDAGDPYSFGGLQQARIKRKDLNRRLKRTMREIGKLDADLARDTVERAFEPI